MRKLLLCIEVLKIHIMGRNVGGAVRWRTANFPKKVPYCPHHIPMKINCTANNPDDKLCTISAYDLIPKLINFLN